MKYSDNLFTTLEFDKIKALLSECAMTEGASAMALALEPTDDPVVIVRRQRRTTDALRLANAKGMPSIPNVRDVGASCERADKGAVLSMRELLDVAGVLRASRMLIDYLNGNKLFDTSLDEIFDRLIPDRRLEERIFRSIISEEMMADEASPALAEIRRKIRNENNKIKDILQKYVTVGSHSKYLQENIVTMRNGRYVVPVKAECKNEVKGLLHDTSASGATMFIEPASVVEANNELRMLQSREEHEIERILAELSSLVSDASNAIWLNYRNISEIAFYFACATLSQRMNGVCPEISRGRTVNLKKARHPLIDRDKVVPVDLSINGGNDTLIITGPNTGGKTVTLKTLGLFALMAQSGLHIPCDEGSELCIFDNIYADIGDAQSIEQSLSTFSSHMVSIVKMLDGITESSLVLFDELCAGTDPVEGAALAHSIIEAVREKGAMCMATTHYAELKAYALQTEGVCNASCEFDVDTLKPTYKLIIGTPGKSNAFAISTKLGLDESIVERAKTFLGSEDRNFETVIEKLESSRIEMEKERERAEQLREEYERFKADNEKLLNRKLAEADKTLEKAREKANAMVQSAKASSDYILAEMDKLRKQRESERLSDDIDEARRKMRAYLRENESKFNPVDEKVDKEYVLPRPLRVGDEVYIVNIDKNGFVVEAPDKNGNVTVQAGIIKTKTKVKNLKLIENSPSFMDKTGKKAKASDYKATVSRDCRDEIDLRGMNGDEAWFKVDKYLDEAMLVGYNSVRLIHGKGTGALKKALWEYLRRDSRIKSYRIGQYGEGDGGVTVVELK